MPQPGIIRGTHHLTFCVGGAQEDYDFHVKLLGLFNVKKTVLFDGELPVYHMYYGNRHGDASTILTAFPYRHVGWMGKRGTNQARYINVSVPADSMGWWADRFKANGVDYSEQDRFGEPRFYFTHPCGLEYNLVGISPVDDREPYDGHGVPAEHAIRGAHGTTTFVRDIEPMAYFLTEGMGGKLLGSEGGYHQFQIGTDEGYGRILEFYEDRDSDQGTWSFGEGTIHHHAFDVIDEANQAVVKDYIVGLGFTDASDVKDRGYFFSVYCRSPSGLLCEFARGTEKGFLIDESEEELGTKMCIPPHWEDRRSEISQLEQIQTVEPVTASAVSDAAGKNLGG
jgi:glyoxalase family protein